jgi:hypothetical protein
MARRGRPAGQPKTGGRKAGTPNKIPTVIKEDILEAYRRLGGITYLVKIGKKSPAEFLKLLGRIIPTEVTGPDGGAIPVTIIKYGRSAAPSTNGHATAPADSR